MSVIDDFLRRVDKLIGLPAHMRDRMISDLREHLNQAVEAGATPEDAVRHMGDPHSLAVDLMREQPRRYAGFWIRTVAFFIDHIVISALIVPPILIVLAFMTHDVPYTWWSEDFGFLDMHGGLVVLGFFSILIFGGWSIAVGLLYFPLLEHLFGATLGKRLFGLRVVMEDGTSVKLGAAFIRRIPYYLDFELLDALFIPFNERKQRAMDKVAETLVVYDPR